SKSTRYVPAWDAIASESDASESAIDDHCLAREVRILGPDEPGDQRRDFCRLTETPRGNSGREFGRARLRTDLTGPARVPIPAWDAIARESDASESAIAAHCLAGRVRILGPPEPGDQRRDFWRLTEPPRGTSGRVFGLPTFAQNRASHVRVDDPGRIWDGRTR